MDEILNSRSLNSVKFRMAKPQGYYTEDVEDFIDNVVRNSIATYELKVSDQEREIVTLNNKIDELSSKNSELEIKANFNDASGSAAQDEALVIALENNESLEKQIATLKADLAEKEEFIKQLNSYIDEIQPYVEAGVSAAALANDVADIPAEEAPEAPEDIPAEDTVEEIMIVEEVVEVVPDFVDEEDDEDEEGEPEVDAAELRAALEAEDSDDDVSSVDEEPDDDLEVDPEALRQAMEESAPKKSYIAKQEVIVEEVATPEAKVESPIADAFFDMDDDLEVDEEELRKALEEADGDDEITTGYR